MPAKSARNSIVVAVITASRCRSSAETPANAALEFVTSERRLIRRMIAEFLGRAGVREEEDVRQELWMHLNQRLQRAIPRRHCRRSMLIAMTRNFFRDERARRRRPSALLSLHGLLPGSCENRWDERHVPPVDQGSCFTMHPCHEHAADLRLDLASTDAKLPATLRSLLELLGTMSVPEAACELRIAKSTAYRWRRSLRERLGHLPD